MSMKLLIAEDDPITRRLLEITLKSWGYEVVVARDGLEAIALLEADNTIRVAILDWMMPGADGLQVCRKVRAAHDDRYVYIILLTARHEKGDLAEAIEAGADDYIAKPFESVELKARLLAGRRIIDLEKQLVDAQELLRHQATHDALTGLWNRGAILDRLNAELSRGARQNSQVSVVLADIDRFKQINDTYGHQIGDAVLQQVAYRMSQAVRDYDFVGRYGGEEFLVVLPGCDEVTAQMLAVRLWESVRQEGDYQVTCSFGVATTAGTCFDAKQLIAKADAALYKAKADGRDQFVMSI